MNRILFSFVNLIIDNLMHALIASKMFTTGRIVFMILFVIVFITLIILSYKKDIKSHKRYYKDAGKKVLVYGVIIVLLFMIIRYLTGH